MVHLKDLFDSNDIKFLYHIVLPQVKYYPQEENIFNVFRMPLDQIKVVILGQDPYYQQGLANGYAFAVNANISKPVSLQRIEKEVGHELDRTLFSWRQQGVFLLNTALTVQAGKPGSHTMYWKDFISEVVKIISREVTPIWMLWGRHAQSYYDTIQAAEHFLPNEILIAAHPATRGIGFLGCNHFNKANQILVEYNKQIINW
jgi:uracil-DNA glycosylase